MRAKTNPNPRMQSPRTNGRGLSFLFGEYRQDLCLSIFNVGEVQNLADIFEVNDET